MSTSYKTPSSFSGFACLGDKCEDTCCRNWDIKLDREHFDLIKNVMSKDIHEKSIFEQYIRINKSSITSDHDYAHIRMGMGGYCAMLDEKGLCSIHAKHGVSILGDVCTMFPRVISRCGNVVELSGALSCPEVVRNCIDETSPLKLSRFKISDLPRKNYPIQRELSDLKDDFYSNNFGLVRNALMEIMASEEHSLENRLYVMANMSHNLSSFYHRKCNKPEDGKIEALVKKFSVRENISKYNAIINDYDAGPLSMIVVHSVLLIKLEQASSENISQCYEKIIMQYCNIQEDNVADVLSRKLQEINARLDEQHRQYIDKAVTRYIINCLYREWYVSMPDPFTYLQMLLVRMSMLRTLIYLDIGYENNLDQYMLNKKIVYIMYNFARNIDQNLDFLKVVYNALSEQSMINFDFSPAFIRIY